MISLFKHTCNIYQQEEVENEWEVTETIWVLKHENVKCTLDRDNIYSMTNTPGTFAEVRYTLFLDKSIIVTNGDKIEVIEENTTFKAQKPFGYKFLNKQEIEVKLWAE